MPLASLPVCPLCPVGNPGRSMGEDNIAEYVDILLQSRFTYFCKSLHLAKDILFDLTGEVCTGIELCSFALHIQRVIHYHGHPEGVAMGGGCKCTRWILG